MKTNFWKSCPCKLSQEFKEIQLQQPHQGIQDGKNCYLPDESLVMRLIQWETTRWGSRRCQLTLFVSKYDDPHYLFRNWDWKLWYCAERHWTSSVLTFWSEYQNTADLLHIKPHQVQNYDLYSGKGLRHTSDKPLEAGWRKLIIKQATHPLKGKWPLVLEVEGKQ